MGSVLLRNDPTVTGAPQCVQTAAFASHVRSLLDLCFAAHLTIYFRPVFGWKNSFEVGGCACRVQRIDVRFQDTEEGFLLNAGRAHRRKRVSRVRP